jgi:hydrogenase expression/formation protein HypC
VVSTTYRSIPAGSDEGEGAMCLAVPGQIVDLVDESIGLASVEIAGVRRTVNVGLIDDTAPGDWVLVHVGFAIARVDEEEARATLALLQEMGAEYETELEELKGSAIE